MVGKLLAVLLSLLLGLSAATQLFAYGIAGRDPALGAPLWREAFVSFYAPWGILVWAWQWGGRSPRPFLWPAVLGVVVCAGCLVRAWLGAPVTVSQVQAHWATRRELKRAGCLSKSGVVLGRLP